MIDLGLLLVIFAAATGSFYKIGLGTYVWGLIYLGTVIVVVRNHDNLVAAVPTIWPVLIFPLLCLVSVLWSIDHTSTLRAAVQYLITAAMALWVGSTFNLRTLYSTLCLALLCCVLVSIIGTYLGVIEGFKQDDYVGAEHYFIGLYMQKNIMGAVLVYAALSTLIAGTVWKRPMIAYCVALALLPPLWLTKSTTALLLYLATLSYGPVLWFLTRIKFKTPVLLSLSLIMLIAIFAVLAADVDVLDRFFAALGKDATLTGRTTIWSKATEVFSDNPVLGTGYQAFWTSSAYANEVMQIRAAVLETISGFHSGYLETLVTLGLLGLAAYVLMVASALIAAGRMVTLKTTAGSLGVLYIVGHIVARTFTESSLYGQHDLEFILLVALTVIAQTSRAKTAPDA